MILKVLFRWVEWRSLLRFQPSLEEFFMIHLHSVYYLGGHNISNPVSTLSWGILYDSQCFLEAIILELLGFQPSLEEFFMIQGSHTCDLSRRPPTFQPSLEEFFMILFFLPDLFLYLFYLRKFQPSLEEFFMIYLTFERIEYNVRGFNPLLRNSLWFVSQNFDSLFSDLQFQPSLEEFFMILQYM